MVRLGQTLCQDVGHHVPCPGCVMTGSLLTTKRSDFSIIEKNEGHLKLFLLTYANSNANAKMSFPRGETIDLCQYASTHDDKLQFQIVDIFIPASDKASRILRDKGFETEFYKVYNIYLFGCTIDGHSVTVEVTDFKPYFFVKLPPAFTKASKLAQLKDEVREALPKRLRDKADDVLNLTFVKRKEFYGFTNEVDFPFLKVTTQTLMLFQILRKYFTNRKADGFVLYESNIDPFIRFIHEQNIAPCGWVSIDVNKCDIMEAASRTQITASVSYKNVLPMDLNRIAPLLVASFDIECSSSHGDFPVAKKDYRKLAQDIADAAKKTPANLLTSGLVKDWIMSAFTETPMAYGTCDKINRVYTKRRPKITSAFHEHVKAFVPSVMDILKTNWRKDDEGEDVDDDDDAAGAGAGGDYAVGAGAGAGGDDDGDDGEQYIVKPKLGMVESQIKEILNSSLPPLQGDMVIQIGTTVHKYGSDEIIYKHIVTLNSCDNIEGSEVETADNEGDVIMKWKEFINRLDPDILTGYNIFGFDFQYIWDRALELGIGSALATGFGRLTERQTELIEQRLSSSALGDNVLTYIDTDGVVLIDLLKVLQRDEKMDSYKLDNAAKQFLGDSKNDLSPNEIFSKFFGSAADRAEIARYCIQDCALVNRIIHKKKVLENNMGMANVVSVPLAFLFMRGQGVKIFSLVAKECRKRKYLIPVINNYDRDNTVDEEGYEGAIVLEPKEGIYIDDPVTVMDFSSLYPSSMIARNISHDSLIVDESYIAPAKERGYIIQTIKYDIYEGKGDNKHIVGVQECHFAQPPNGEKGIIPSILQMLLTQRKNTRKKIEYETVTMNDGSTHSGLVKRGDATTSIADVETGEKVSIPTSDIVSIADTYNDFEKVVLDALQNAYKVTANSLYGQTGAPTSPIFCKFIAACTTATGREMIYLAKNFAETHYGVEVIYGDSVTSYTPVLIRHNNIIKIRTIESLADEFGNNQWVSCKEHGKQEKEACELTDVESWTENGWTKIHRVIRHILVETKQIIRVNTHHGVVDVTDDHSLLTNDGKEISPKELQVGNAILHHSYPEIVVQPTKITVEEARIMGVQLYYKKDKIVPDDILNADIAIRHSFWNGLCTAAYETNGTLKDIDSISFATISLLASSIGYDTDHTDHTDHTACDVYSLNLNLNLNMTTSRLVKLSYEKS